MPNDDLNQLLRNMRPQLIDKQLVFVSLPADQLQLHIAECVAMVKEQEGTTFVLSQNYADTHGLSYSGEYQMISLTVQSSLDGYGLVAAFAKALADNGLPANVFAGFYHDHILIPATDAERAVQVLEDLSRQAQ